MEKISLCEFYSEIYNGVVLPSQSTENRLQIQTKLDSALPELYAAVIVFSVKAATYFQAKGTCLLVSSTHRGDYVFSMQSLYQMLTKTRDQENFK